jgi:hypothetical protein
VKHAVCTGELRNVYNILVRKPEGNIPRYRWEDNFKMNLKNAGREDMHWIHLA